MISTMFVVPAAYTRRLSKPTIRRAAKCALYVKAHMQEARRARGGGFTEGVIGNVRLARQGTRDLREILRGER